MNTNSPAYYQQNVGQPHMHVPGGAPGSVGGTPTPGGIPPNPNQVKLGNIKFKSKILFLVNPKIS